MSTDSALAPLIAATAQWFDRAYPSGRGALQRGLAQAQSRQAVTLAAWLRYPTRLDVHLVALTGPGGSGRLDWITGSDFARAAETADPRAFAWRTWVDEVVASWAACLLGTPSLAEAAARAVTGTEHVGAVPVSFRRLTEPDPYDHRGAELLRHPDLLAPVADLHRSRLLARLEAPA
ncbi:hypothetical protein ACFY7H_12230 [Streptomyces sp. NPDC012794]|uniref:hypothetical protein n=1 Tax=Streptomyces sp. NPDC012794 TaxID=3364850 RepID=UPI0036AEDBED